MKKLFVLVALSAVVLSVSADAPAAGAARSYNPTTTSVRIDGVITRGVTATVVDTQTAAGTTSEATLKLMPHAAGASMVAWMSSTLEGYGARKRVELLTLDGANVTSSEALDGPFIEQMDLPALDAEAAKDLALWTLRLSSTPSHATGPQPPLMGLSFAPQVMSNAANFRVQIDGIDGSRIIRVDPISVRTTLLPPRREDLGSRRLPRPATSTSTFSSLVLTTSMTGATLPGFQQWLGGDHTPRAGAIVLLSPSLQQVLCTVRMKNVVITKITTSTPGPESVARARVELTVAGLELAMP